MTAISRKDMNPMKQKDIRADRLFNAEGDQHIGDKVSKQHQRSRRDDLQHTVADIPVHVAQAHLLSGLSVGQRNGDQHDQGRDEQQQAAGEGGRAGAESRLEPGVIP
jgi:hypothetical protein